MTAARPALLPREGVAGDEGPCWIRRPHTGLKDRITTTAPNTGSREQT